jgi:hypothetical protein
VWKGKTLTRTLGAFAGTVALGAALAVGPASPAAADNFDGTCNAGELCLFWGYNYMAPSADFYNAVSNYHGWNFWNSQVWLNDNTASAFCHTVAFSCTVWENSGYWGVKRRMARGEKVPDLGALVDNISSHKFPA